MTIAIQDKAPNFELADENGNLISLHSYKGKNVVLYFYPKDNTPGCTLEAQDFSKIIKDFQANNTVVIGISKDTSACHKNFIDMYDLKVILLADINGEVCKKYDTIGIKKMFGKEYMGINRTTFLVNADGIILHIWPNVKTTNHAAEVLDKIKTFNA